VLTRCTLAKPRRLSRRPDQKSAFLSAIWVAAKASCVCLAIRFGFPNPPACNPADRIFYFPADAISKFEPSKRGSGHLAPAADARLNSPVRSRKRDSPIPVMTRPNLEIAFAGEVKEFDPLDYMPADWKPNRMARHTQLAFAATQDGAQECRL